MISTQDIKNKEVINIYDGKSLGFVEDIEVNLEKGTIEGIIVPEPRGFFSFFGRPGEQVIRWRDIKRIGDDVILVDVAGALDSDYDSYGRDFAPGYETGYGQGYGQGGPVNLGNAANPLGQSGAAVELMKGGSFSQQEMHQQRQGEQGPVIDPGIQENNE